MQRRQQQEYWNDVDKTFAKQPAMGAQGYQDKAYPELAEKRKAVEDRYRAVEEEMKMLVRAKQAALHMNAIELEQARVEGLLQRARVAEEEALKAAQGGEARAAAPGYRPGFQQPHNLARMGEQPNGRPMSGAPDMAALANRLKNERFGGSPLQGGGFTIRYTTARQEREKLEHKLAEVLQKRAIYEADIEGGRAIPVPIRAGPQSTRPW